MQWTWDDLRLVWFKVDNEYVYLFSFMPTKWSWVTDDVYVLPWLLIFQSPLRNTDEGPITCGSLCWLGSA